MSSYGNVKGKEETIAHVGRMRNSGQRFSKPALLISIVTVVFFVIAASSLLAADKQEENVSRSARTRRQATNTSKNDPCEFSDEAKRAGKNVVSFIVEK